MQNIDELIKSLTDNYDKMKDGQMRPHLGKELTNAAGKIMIGLKLKMDYNKDRCINEPINFLESKK